MDPLTGKWQVKLQCTGVLMYRDRKYFEHRNNLDAESVLHAGSSSKQK